MGLMDFLKRLVGGGGSAEWESTPVNQARFDADDLAVRLGMSVEQLAAVPINYRKFTLPKRSGGKRDIAAPNEALKKVQGMIHRRLLKRLSVHPCVRGFEPRHSIVTNAVEHVGKSVVMRMDIRNFFSSTDARRVELYFQIIGWDQQVAALLTRLCTLDGHLPQGASTSPKLSNLVNYRMDARLSGLARRLGAVYTRYADDMTFSFDTDDRGAIHGVIGSTKAILADFGYRLHQDKKLRISRRHNQQKVTGLVVNESVNLPRSVRRRLRAVAHHIDNDRTATMTRQQLDGWKALEKMIRDQASPSA